MSYSDSYWFDSRWFRLVSRAEGLGFVDRAVFREFMDLASESVEIMICRDEAVNLVDSLSMALGEDGVRSAIDRLLRARLLSCNDGIYTVPALVAGQQDKEMRPAPKNTRVKGSLFSMLQDTRQSGISKQSFISKSREDLSKDYGGWLPTENFDVSGEVLLLTNELLEQLSTRYAHIAVEGELTKIYEYLRDAPQKRRSCAETSSLVNRWMERSNENMSSLSEGLNDALGI